MKSKTYSEIYDDMKNYVVTHQDQATDLNAGSVISSILEAIARQIASAYIAVVANVDIYQKTFSAEQFGLSRNAGIAASGTVVFSRSTPALSDISIPVGTVLTTASGLVFTTLELGSILTDALTSGSIRVQCSTTGATGNVDAGAINQISSSLANVESVTNAAALSGGTSEETVEAFEARFSEYVVGLGRCSTSGVEAAALGVDGIRSVSLVEHFPPTAGYNFSLYAENGAGSLPSAMQSAIETIIFGDGLDNYGYKAAGINARILAPTIIHIDVDATLVASTTYPRSYIEADINDKIVAYIDSLGIGEQVQEVILADALRQQFGILGVQSVVFRYFDPNGTETSSHIDGSMIARSRTNTIIMENPA